MHDLRVVALNKRRWLIILIAIGMASGAAVLILVSGGLRAWSGSTDMSSNALTDSDRVAAGNRATRGNPVSSSATHKSAAEPGLIHFVELATDESGIRFHQFSGNSPDKLYPAANGTGVAMLDYDGDGWMDLYFVTSTKLPLDPKRTDPHNELYRNRGDNTFEETTASSASGHNGFGQGVTATDFDNDGFPDIYLPCYGRNVLYLNNGDGTFRDASEASGTGDKRWGTSAAALDYDSDGSLDLYIANYGKWTPENNPFCGDAQRGIRTFCNPRTITPETHALYRNHGDGTWRDELPTLGLDRKDGRGQGVVSADLDGDGRIDLYVANDICPNFVFLNRGDGRLEDYSDLSGASRSIDGIERAGMGVDVDDVTGDGRPEIFVTNFHGEPNSMFRNDGDGFFTEITSVAGFQSSGIPMVKWGTRLIDFDGDTWPDIFVTSGHVDDNLVQMGNQNAPHDEPALLWRNKGTGRFELVSDSAGSYFERTHVGRGAAFGDLDNDGDTDIVVNHVDGVPALLLNDSGAVAATRDQKPNHWIRFVLRGVRSNRDAIGARVTLHLAGEARGRTIVRQFKGGSSYGSAHDPRLVVGVGSATSVARVEIRWPSGAVTNLEQLATERDHVLTEP
jgi:hypothetical protein